LQADEPPRLSFRRATFTLLSASQTAPPPHPVVSRLFSQAKKLPTKAELKKIKKTIAEKRKGGLEAFTDEEIELAGFLVEGA